MVCTVGLCGLQSIVSPLDADKSLTVTCHRLGRLWESSWEKYRGSEEVPGEPPHVCARDHVIMFGHFHNTDSCNYPLIPLGKKGCLHLGHNSLAEIAIKLAYMDTYI